MRRGHEPAFLNGSFLARCGGRQFFWLALLGGASFLPAWATEKPGMPDLAQVENTCLPTSTANILIWFGHHGYPRLILPGDSEDEREAHSIHRLMADTVARYDLGTQMTNVLGGIHKYIQDAGYEADVEFRGLGSDQAFTREWLNQNDDPNKGFILLLYYCRLLPNSDTFAPVIGIGHAVTLVNAEENMLLIHDPGHLEDEPGRKIITTYTLTRGQMAERDGTASVAGLMMLTGSLLEAPPDSKVMLVGAVCITMHPVGEKKSPPLVAKTDAARTDADRSWFAWLFDFFYRK